jgi:hypothetical protein
MAGADVAGNYKGVMLCNRPADSAPAFGPAHLTPTCGAPQFRPVGVAPEPLGLNPARDNPATNVAKAHEEAARRRAAAPNVGHENFLTKHRRWLSEMAKQKAALNDELEATAQAAKEKRRRFSEYCKATRDSGVRTSASVSAAPAAEPTTQTTGEAAPDALVAEEAPVQAAPEHAASQALTAKPPASAASKAKGGKRKPKWAMTEDEADDAEDAEADALVDFASGLDYTSFIDDLEVRQALSVIKERIDAQKALVQAAARAEDISEDEALAAMAEASALDGDDWKASFLSKWNAVHREEDAESVRSGGSRASKQAGGIASGETQQQPDWDSSTNAGDRVSRGPPATAVEMARSLLETNPDLASKHSLRSLAAVVQTATGKVRTGSSATTQSMRDLMASELPPLKLVTITDGARPAGGKKVDASNLPYLHRNPAV